MLKKFKFYLFFLEIQLFNVSEGFFFLFVVSTEQNEMVE